MIPAFDERGRLPPGIHWSEWPEIEERFGHSPRRQILLEGLLRALQSLRAAGCRRVYIDGSFATAKENPGDFDGCWSIAGVDPAQLDPVLLLFDSGRAAQKAKYGGELFPAELPEGVSGKLFLDFFQTDRETGDRKGIIALDLEGLP
jgi:hypothetical protein